MILIADSGSTKVEFKLLGGEKSETFTLPGINPYYQSEAEIKKLIGDKLYPELTAKTIQEIYFYGAGCAFPEKKKILENIFSYFFPDSAIQIHSDLLAASRALFGTEKGVACILGTGSNSCLYNGKEIEQNVSPLGFILGDEGSGAVLGRKFVSDCLKNQMPAHLKENFFRHCKTTPAEIMENVYKRPFPNRYLASFSPFLFENKSEEYIYQLIKTSFTEFFQRNINQYSITNESLGFVGSIAYYFQEILQQVAHNMNYRIDKIFKNPMEGLIQYHQNNTKK